MKLKYVVAAACAALILVPLTAVHLVLRASLPSLDGEVHHLGIVSPVTIDRDGKGAPTIEAANRVDLAYGIGYAHGQDRFFEMDLSRRLPAGELSEVFGKVALEQDEKARLFRFRQVARAALLQGTPEQRAVLEAYARGVNAGLASLRSRPWEYWVLGSVPVQWRPEDTLLVSHAMWWDLQYSGIDREILRVRINERMHGPECEGGWKCGLQFLYPQWTAWDAPNSPVGVINGGGASQVPAKEVLDVRDSEAPATALAPVRDDSGIGSNNWAVSGRFTTTGAALIANDMHLRARVPVIWYHARMRVRASETQPALDLNGVTLPGTPLLVAGSNTHIAWGFTNSYGDWVDVKKDTCAAAVSEQQEDILVKGAPTVHYSVKSGPAGVLYRQDSDGSCWYVSWLAQQASATNINLMSLEHATTVAQAIALAPTLGIPHQNLVVGDSQGHIAWTIGGRIPSDTAPGRATGSPTWTTVDAHPKIVDPEIGRIWTANSRPTDDKAQLAAIGGADTWVGADYDDPPRTRQIRDDLLALKGPATPADMLRIQLDDRAVFLTHWRAFEH